jgi:uncharacterized protein (DUF1499 family)
MINISYNLHSINVLINVVFFRFTEVIRVIKKEPSWEIVNEIPEEGVVEFVATTKLMKYKDDVVVVVSADPQGREWFHSMNQTTIQTKKLMLIETNSSYHFFFKGGAIVNVRSKSRVGDEDFGTNRRRIKYLLDQLYHDPPSQSVSNLSTNLNSASQPAQQSQQSPPTQQQPRIETNPTVLKLKEIASNVNQNSK